MKNSENIRKTEAEAQFRKRYLKCRQLMEKDERFSAMTDIEKDTYAQRLATPEYLDLTSDFAFKLIFQEHPDLLILLLNDILQENIETIEFQNTELGDVAPLDKKVLFDILCKTPDRKTFLVEMQKVSRSDQRDRLIYYGSRLVGKQIKPGDKKYVLSPVKVICIMNYEDKHIDSPANKILYQYKTIEIETGEPFGDQISFYLLELPRIMRYTDEYESPVASWCRIFRNFAIFARSREQNDARFKVLERAMRISGLNDKQIDNYFSDMLTKEEMLPYIEGAEQQGYHKGFEEGEARGRAEVARALLKEGMPFEQVAKYTGMSIELLKGMMGQS